MPSILSEQEKDNFIKEFRNTLKESKNETTKITSDADNQLMELFFIQQVEKILVTTITSEEKLKDPLNFKSQFNELIKQVKHLKQLLHRWPDLGQFIRRQLEKITAVNASERDLQRAALLYELTPRNVFELEHSLTYPAFFELFETLYNAYNHATIRQCHANFMKFFSLAKQAEESNSREHLILITTFYDAMKKNNMPIPIIEISSLMKQIQQCFSNEQYSSNQYFKSFLKTIETKHTVQKSVLLSYLIKTLPSIMYLCKISLDPKIVSATRETKEKCSPIKRSTPNITFFLDPAKPSSSSASLSTTVSTENSLTRSSSCSSLTLAK